MILNIFVLLYLSLHWGDIIEQIKKSVMYTLRGNVKDAADLDYFGQYFQVYSAQTICLNLSCLLLVYLIERG